jgi:hypothetical protein
MVQPAKPLIVAAALLAAPCMILALPVAPAQASAGSIAWVDQFGSRSSESGTWGLDIFANDVFTGGRTFGALPGQVSRGDADAWIRRTGAHGGAVWTTQFGSPAFDNVEDVDATSSGVYALGATRGDLAGPSMGGTDAYLARFDRDGKRLWISQFGVTQDDWGISVVEGKAGIYVYGQTFGAFPGYRNRGGADLFIALFDLQGSLRWIRQFGSRGHEEPWAMEAAHGGVYIDGYTDGRLGGSRTGSWDAYVAYISWEGRMVWLRQFGSTQADFASGLSADASGVYVSGQTYGTLPGATNRGGSDAFVRKFSPTGSDAWARQFGTRADDAAGSAALIRDEVVVAGSTDGAFPGQTNFGATDVFAQGFGSGGGETGWTFQFGTRGTETVGWALGRGNRVFVIGDTAGAFQGSTSAGGVDSFLARIDVRGSRRGE